MKKLLCLALAAALVLSLAACGGTSTESEKTDTDTENAVTDTSNWHFTLGTPLSYETEFTADDGTVIMSEKYELPLLMLADENGNEIDLSTDGTAMGDICDVFNGQMQDKNDAIAAEVDELLAEAKESYAARTADSGEWTAYSFEYSIGETYMTDGLLSIVCNEFGDFGGTHPSSMTETWNFDLVTGEFVTLATLTGDDNPLGQVLADSLSSSVLDKISAENLDVDYNDGYIDVINNLAENAQCYFTETGMTVYFDTYVLAPYYAGPQAFDILYSEFYYALSTHMQQQFELSQEDIILSDYMTVQVFWSWFNMSMPPIDVEGGIDLETNNPLYPVKLGYVKTLDELRALLCSRVSEELADTWLATGKFVERDGTLYAAMGERGGDITIGSLTYEVEMNGTDGTLIQTVHRQDFDAAAQDYVLTGETEEISYPFTLNDDGHAVFSAFPCPL